MSRIPMNQALLALTALSVATMGPGLTAEAMPSRPRRRSRPVPEPGSHYVSGRWVLDWIQNPDSPDSRFALISGFRFEAFPDGRFTCKGNDWFFSGSSKNHSLNNAMNAAEKMWVANKEHLLVFVQIEDPQP